MNGNIEFVMVPPIQTMRSNVNGLRRMPIGRSLKSLGGDVYPKLKSVECKDRPDLTVLCDFAAAQAQVIAEQQKALADKDRQLEQIRKERDTLNSRLERSERRSALVANSIASCSPASPPPFAVPKTPASAKSVAPFKKRTFSAASTSASCSEPKKKSKSGGKLTLRESLDSALGHKSTVGTAEAEEEEIREYSGDPQPDGCLFQPGLDPKAGDVLNFQRKTTVAVPLWRIKAYLTTKSGHKLEQLDDDTYARRHAKYELEEKRLVKRDRMRQRELMIRKKMEKEKEARKCFLLSHLSAATVDAAPDTRPFDLNMVEAIEIVKGSTQRKSRRTRLSSGSVD